MSAGELLRKGGGGDTNFDWNRPIKTLFTVGTTLGGETLGVGIERALFAFRPATISLNSLPLREVGESFAPTLSGSITLNDETIVTARRIRNVTDGITLNQSAANAINYTAPAVTMLLGVTKSYRLEAEVDNNGNPVTILSPVRDLEGAYPFLIGINAAAGLQGNAAYVGLTKHIEKQGNKAKSLTGSGRIYCLYPATMPDLTSILDPSGFESLNDFVKSTVSVSSSGLAANWTINFKKYEFKNIATLSNHSWQFKF